MRCSCWARQQPQSWSYLAAPDGKRSQPIRLGLPQTNKRLNKPKRHRDYVASSYEYRWIGPDNRIYTPDTVANEAEEFLVSTSSGSNLPPALNRDSRPLKTIVSLSPTVILMVPTSKEDPRQWTLLGPNHPVRFFGAPDSWNTSGYDCGATVFYDERMHWFSPDLQCEPQPVAFTNGTAEIQLPDGRLALSVEGQVCRIRRE